jgi:DNA processing protein
MGVHRLTLRAAAYPERLRDIPTPPEELFYIGADPSEWLGRPKVAIVGSRGVTPYGGQVTERLSRELAERGVVIISGLALGVDGIAHTACLNASGITVAVLGNGLDKVYPARHTQLAQRLLDQGGTILSEYPEGTPSYPGNFVARNRIVAGLADALLITEAAVNSGTLHTARFALEQGREVLAVPGNITSPHSAGTNNLIKAGAHPATSVEDILYVLGAKATPVEPVRRQGDNAEEQALLSLLYGGMSDGHELLVTSKLPAVQFNTTLTMLEISGKIRPLGNNHWAVR